MTGHDRLGYPVFIMKIAKPILLVSTPIGVIWGLYEAWQVRWWLGLLMLVLVGVIAVFAALTVRQIRLERLESR